MIKIKRSLDIHKVLQSHSDIVHDEKRVLGGLTRSVFTSIDLINWLLDNHNPTNTDKEGLEKLVNEELVDPTLPHQLMYPIDMGIMDSKKKVYRFIEDQFIEFKKDSTIINLHGLDTSIYHFFYEQQEELSVFKVMEELNEVLQSIYTEFAHEDGTKIDYDGLVDSELFNLKYLPLATKLAYLDLSPLIANDNQLKAFFINVYNAFAIHVMLARYGHKKKLDISTLERLDTFNTYKYNIGGHNYTLNDIYQGILRGNDAAGSSVGAAAMQFMFKVKSKTPRFKENDPRYKFVVRNFDPRIHFALNYGANSCPPLRLYTAIDIDEQLEAATKEFCNKDCAYLEVKGKKYVCMSQIFKYYSMDFGNNYEDVLRFLGKYIEREVIKQEILAAAEKPNSVNYEFQKFDMNTNIYKPEKKAEPVEEKPVEKEQEKEKPEAVEESAEKPAEK